MGPDPKTQIRWGVGTLVAAIMLVAVLAFVPDPFFRQRVFATTLDNVEGIQPGVKIYFRGATVGEVRSVALEPATRTFTVRLGVVRAWRPSTCSFASVASANPFTAPRIELGVLDSAPAQCRAALALARCEPVKLASGSAAITGCRRPPDLFQTASLAVGQAANVARTANAMALRLQTMLTGPDGTRSAVDMASVARNATETLAALNSLSNQLDRSFTPGRGDIALTLANVRKATGRASEVDIASLNAILAETKMLVAQNQASIAGLLSEGRTSAAEARMLLQGASASLVNTTANLERTSNNLGALTERLSADPTFAIRGQRYADPPAPGGQ